MCRSPTRNAFTICSVLIDNSFPSLLSFFFFRNNDQLFPFLLLSIPFFLCIFSARRDTKYTRTKKNFAKEIGRQKSETKPILKPRAFLSLRITTVNRYTTHEDVKGTRASISDESSYSSLLDYQNNFFPISPWIISSALSSILNEDEFICESSEILEFLILA